MAVAAAVIVGLRQAGIADGQAQIARDQTAILARQSRTDAQRLRSELFDRRIQLVEALADAYVKSRQMEQDGVELSRFQNLSYRGYFLFDYEVGKSLMSMQRFYSQSYTYSILLKMAREANDQEAFIRAFRRFTEFNQAVEKAYEEVVPMLSPFLSLEGDD